MPKGRYVDLVLPDKRSVSLIFSRMLEDGERIALPKKHKATSYNRQKDILIGSYFGMSTVEQVQAGIAFDMVYSSQEDRYYLRINHKIKVPVYDQYEWRLLMLFFDGDLVVDQDKYLREKESAILYTFRKWNPLFTKHFGLAQSFSYTLLRHLRMLSMIRDNNAPELDVLSLFGYHTNKLVGRKTLEAAQESLLQHTRGIKYKED